VIECCWCLEWRLCRIPGGFPALRGRWRSHSAAATSAILHDRRVPSAPSFAGSTLIIVTVTKETEAMRPRALMAPHNSEAGGQLESTTCTKRSHAQQPLCNTARVTASNSCNYR